MTTVVLTSEELPARLRALGWKSPIYVRGPLHEGPAVAIVGARAATTVSMDRAHHIARHLAQRGVNIVSGGALGIDGAAHRGALAGGGITTVVLGSGCDVLYPERHAPLFETALARGGAIVSMLKDGTEPHRGTFLSRNRLIAALADGVIVVEADVRSGSLATARAAIKSNRVLAAWPGSRGCDRLLGQGAAIVESIHDAELVALGAPRMPTPVIDRDPDAARVREAIAAGASGVEEIMRHTGLPLRAVLRVLPTLERYS
ncbi:MAG: DNA-protecting protein DprA [Myxococcota bacterium]|nr:DNA-protecting protein DprA [Myxococcota bacterium]